ncbi:MULTISPECIES: lipid-A-disaccharide synthase N-terminal domain-containing protein [Rhodanobacter]|uniref:Lipid-A-disaccharide synthase N-terminal domain-containing protein n=1 Tax=Rhodanobacter hydrolyticus TaxID=2250595 RepID=A0ABW8J3J5_9GAMM|nr:lipid-A-disaccharide synthase N-terminal domain-containing protein [Rhodanobacter sp. 7MK24]MBD8879348.1 lipid-A-disaccharide synthase N-terminal domain-containing protein [Rhodanobacter sp. 7MK24]
MDARSVWLAVGLLGQALFGARFVVQWLHSEMLGKSRFPRAFWQISVAAGMLILAYAIHRRDPVFIAGEAMTLAIFCRNLQLIGRSTSTKAATERHPVPRSAP